MDDPSKADDENLAVAYSHKTPKSPPMHSAHLGQAWSLVLCFASCSPLTNSNSYFPTLWYTWHARRCILEAFCMRISVTGASSPQSIRYFRYDCSGLYAIWLSLTWLSCSCVVPFRTGAPVYVVESFLPHILYLAIQSTHHSLFRNVRFNQWR